MGRNIFLCGWVVTRRSLLGCCSLNSCVFVGLEVRLLNGLQRLAWMGIFFLFSFYSS